MSDESELDFKEEEVVTTECFLFEDDDAETIILEAYGRDVLGKENVERETRIIARVCRVQRQRQRHGWH